MSRTISKIHEIYCRMTELRVVKLHACDVDVVKSYSAIGEVKFRTKLSHGLPAEQKWMIAFNFIRTDFIRRTANADREFYRSVTACLATNSTEVTFLVTEGLFQANVSQFLLERQSPLCDRAWSWFKQCPTQPACDPTVVCSATSYLEKKKRCTRAIGL